MWTRLKKTLRLSSPTQHVEPTLDGNELIRRIDVGVEALCPCGSAHIHHLTLMSLAECRRCGHTFGIRSIQFLRTGPSAVPTTNIVTVGYLVTPESLAKRQTRGVH